LVEERLDVGARDLAQPHRGGGGHGGPHRGGHAPRRRRTATISPTWYAVWSADRRISRSTVCPPPCAIRANKSTLGSMALASNVARSARKVRTLSSHAVSLGGAGSRGQ